MTEILKADDLIKIMDEIRSEVDALVKPDIITENLNMGYQISAHACEQPQFVEMTPIFKNMLKHTGFNGRLKVDDPPTEAEKLLYDNVVAKLNTYIGPRVDKYNLGLPIDDPQHYVVDCWRNLKENMRDIQPGQAEQRAQAFKLYQTKAPELGVRKLLTSNPVFMKAVGMVYDALPSIKAIDNIIEVAAPFMKKHTNVSYPYFRNDRTIDKETGKSYGELSRDLAEQIMSSPNWYEELKQYVIWTALARNQRGKGRALIASSRVINLCINMIEAPEIVACKEKCSLFAGYKGPEDLKKVLCKMADDCKANGYWATNWDQSAYDQHVSRDLIELIGAMAVLKANGERSKQLAKARAVFACRGWLVYGPEKSIVEIFGRIFSGYIDTNLGGGKINAIVSLFVLMMCDPHHSEIWYKLLYSMLVMGDDNLQIHRKVRHDDYVRHMKEIGFDVNPNKGEEGIFFLQRRIIKPKNSPDYIMVTPVTRIIKSMCFKEHSSSLGPYGWVAATIQILSQLVEYPAAMDVAVSVLYPFDKMKLGTELTGEQLAQLLNEEDQKAYAGKASTKNYAGKRTVSGHRKGHVSAAAKQRRFIATADLLYDGDPTKEGMFNRDDTDNPTLNTKFVDRVLDAIRASVARTNAQTLVNTQGTADLESKEVIHNVEEDEI